MKKLILPALLSSLTLSACGGGGSENIPAELDPSKVTTKVSQGPFESYVTDHSKRNRMRLWTSSDTRDVSAATTHDWTGPTSPSDYKDFIALNDSRMTIEVLGRVRSDSASQGPQRLIRITVDQEQLKNVEKGRLITTSGEYYFRGSSFAWATIDNGPLLSGKHAEGLTNLVLDFGKGTASIDLRTEVGNNSEVEISLSAKDLPFNITSGAYGGKVNIELRNPNGPETYSVGGDLLGYVGGTPTYVDNKHAMSTSGIFNASGTDQGSAIRIDGVYHGVDPNAAP